MIRPGHLLGFDRYTISTPCRYFAIPQPVWGQVAKYNFCFAKNSTKHFLLTEAVHVVVAEATGNLLQKCLGTFSPRARGSSSPEGTPHSAPLHTRAVRDAGHVLE